MNNVEYANAYSEVLEILKYISNEDYNKIPKEKIEVFENNASKEYVFKYDPSKTLDEQNVSKRTKAIIGLLFRDYWATPKQKEEIVAKQNYNRNLIEEGKKSEYDVEKFFNSKKDMYSDSEIKEVSIVEHREPIIKRIINKIKDIFNIT